MWQEQPKKRQKDKKKKKGKEKKFRRHRQHEHGGGGAGVLGSGWGVGYRRQTEHESGLQSPAKSTVCYTILDKVALLTGLSFPMWKEKATSGDHLKDQREEERLYKR